MVLMKSLFISLSLILLLSVTGCQTKPVKKEASKPATTPPSTLPVKPAVAPTPSVDSSGLVTTASGLQYRVMASGPADGRSPTLFDSVMVHYRGTLTDGTVFDSSIDRGQPATFGVGQVIPGWTEALRLMKPGDQWMLYIPSRLAYGDKAVGGAIPANSDLIFQVQLLQVISGF